MAKQSQPLRIENPRVGSFGTARTINSVLWFVNNRPLEERILGYLARYQEKHQVPLYAFVFQGNHYHVNALFPNSNRAAFYRDFNARSAEAVRALVPEFPGGPLFERRYSEQALPRQEDIEESFFYCALQPVHAGLVKDSLEYPGYNSFFDAISGIERTYKIIDWARYNDKKRFNKKLSIKDFTHEYRFKYQRLPGYEHLSQREYKKLMLGKYEERRKKIVAEYLARGHRFLNSAELKKVRPGSLPKNTKKSTRYDRRPLVLTSCLETKKHYLSWYFSIYAWYKKASRRYLRGAAKVEFPNGTYKPPGPFTGVLRL